MEEKAIKHAVRRDLLGNSKKNQRGKLIAFVISIKSIS